MTIYYVKQDNTIWGCGEPGCCGEWYEEIDETFINCECDIPEAQMTGDHLQGCVGGGPVLKWRKAKRLEIQAFEDGKSEGFGEGWNAGEEYERKKTIELLKKDFFHDILGETITLESGMEPQRVIRHGNNCVSCTAIAMINGENK